jgi:hypothetical protein
LTNPQSFNRYSYVQNDPVNFVDPTGLDPDDPNDPPPTTHTDPATGLPTSVPGVNAGVVTIEIGGGLGIGTGSGLGIIDQFEVDTGTRAVIGGEGSQEPTTGNPEVIDNSGSANQSCGIQISFSGSYDGLLNGPSVPNSSAGPVYGIGFSVRISGLSGNVAMRSTEKDPRPKGTWLIEQWVADFNFKNGTVVRQDTTARMDNFAVANPRPRRDGNTVSWWDHPGTVAAGVQGYFTKRNFYIKAYNGERHCEAAFHLTFRVFNGQMTNVGWGYGNYR